MAHVKSLLAALGAVFGVLFVPTLIRFLFLAGREKSTGFALVLNRFVETLTSPLFWIELFSVFALFFVAGRLRNKARRVLATLGADDRDHNAWMSDPLATDVRFCAVGRLVCDAPLRSVLEIANYKSPITNFLTASLAEKTPRLPHRRGSSSSTSESRESHQGRPAPRRALFGRAGAATDRPSARKERCGRRLLE
jgi:hypothetical protein